MRALVFVLTIPLVVSLVWQAGLFAPRAIEIALASLLAIAASVVLRADMQRRQPVPRWTAVVLLLACALSAAIGGSPGLITGTLTAAAAMVAGIAVAAAAFAALRSRGDALFVFTAVWYAALASASLVTGMHPVLARLLISH